MATRLKSPIPYPGSKSRVANTICRLGRANGYEAERIVDVFIGGGSLLLGFAEELPRVALVANDFDPAIAALWRCIADPATAERLCSQLPDAITQQNIDNANAIIDDKGKAPDDVTLAVAEIFTGRSSYRGGLKQKHRTRADGNKRYKGKTVRECIGNIAAAVAGRLIVHEEDFETVIQRYDETGTLLLLDPPYHGHDEYRPEFPPEAHERLAACLEGLEHAAWVMTNGMDSLTYSLYGDGKAVVLPLRVAGSKGSRLERMIVPHKTMFPGEVIRRVPVTDLQAKTDSNAVHGQGPDLMITVPGKQGTQATKGKKKVRGRKPKTPVVEAMTDEEAKLLAGQEAAIEEAMYSVLEGFVAIGFHLMHIDQLKLYRASHRTFAEYCEGRWHMSPGRAYQLMRGVVAFEAIKVQFAKRKGRDAAMQEGLVPANEAQVRSLVPLLGNDTRKGKKAVCTVWKRVLGRTAAGEPLTAGLVAEEVSKWKRDHGEEPRASWDYEASPLGNLRPLEARIGKVTDVKALDSAVAQLRKLMQALERKREELASAPPK